MRLKASVRDVLRFAVAAGRAGGAWLGIGLLVSGADPFEILGAAAGSAILVGGIAANARRHLAARLAGCIIVVALVRAAAGPGAAAAMAVLLAVGWWIRMTPADALTGLAIFGIGAAAMGMASLRLVACFWTIGAAWVGGLRAWCWYRRRRLPVETGPAALLARDN